MKSGLPVPSRLVIVLLVLAGLTAVFALPETPPMQECALRLELPSALPVSGWAGGPDETNFTRERQILAADTELRRKSYFRPVYSDRGIPELSVLQATLVLSGYELNNSLHRPERCLPAQGFQVRESREMQIPMPDGNRLRVTRLRCEGADPRSGEPFTHLNYYFFVGHDSVTGSHYARTLRDMRDRLFKGYDQRWAYVTVAANLIGGTVRNDDGAEFVIRAGTEEETDQLVAEFVAELFPVILNPDSSIRVWE